MAFITPELLTCLGIAFAIGLSSQGSMSASSVSGSYISRYDHPASSVSSRTTTPTLGNFLKPLIPIVISGVLAIYGFIIALLLCFKYQTFETTPPDITAGYKYLAAGLSVGLSCLWSGMGITGYISDYIYLYSPPYASVKNGTTTIGAYTRANGSTGSSSIRSRGTTGTSNENDTDSVLEPLLVSGSSDERKHAHGQSTTTMTAFPEPDLHFCMALVYFEAIGLYGFIVAIVLVSM